MLSKEENELLCRVGPGTPMGDLMRRYWIPALMPVELPTPDGDPLRVRLLGEDLIAFRDSSGQVGLVGDHCPHRGASLFFGRNEEGGLRCVYHGWKFDTSGDCVDMPNEPPESNFKEKIHHTAYPCVEQGGVIWAYMGPPEHQPPLPDLESNLVPADHCFVSKRLQESNYAQAFEGGIDSSHGGFLHGALPQISAAQGRSSTANRYVMGDKHPRFQVVETEYGVMIGAKRTAEAERDYWRVNMFLMPFYTMAPSSGPDPVHRWSAWVPMDDENTMRMTLMWHPVRPLDEPTIASLTAPGGIHLAPEEYLPTSGAAGGRWRSRANRANDYFIDRQDQRTRTFSGILGVGTQDQAVQEGMGAIYDRSREHLGTSDLGVIATRRLLLNAARELRENGTPPLGALSPAAFQVRSVGVMLPKDADWAEGVLPEMEGTPGTNRALV